MASPQLASDAPVQLDEKVNGHMISGNEEGVATAEQGMQGMDLLAVGDSTLHRACAEGRLEDVREILTRSTEALESLGELGDSFHTCGPS